MAQQQEDNRISYIKKPLAAHSFMCAGLASIGLMLCIVGMAIGVRTQGNVPLGGVAVCFSSLLFSVVSLRYGALSFKEKEKNYILAKIGVSAGAVLTILWIVIMLVGIRR